MSRKTAPYYGRHEKKGEQRADGQRAVNPDGCTIQHLSDRNATVAMIRAVVAGTCYEASGSAKREKGDEYNEDIGVTLAAARALRNLATAMETVAREQVEEAERVKKARRSRHPAHQVARHLTFMEIMQKYGPEAVQRAALRRGFLRDGLDGTHIMAAWEAEGEST